MVKSHQDPLDSIFHALSDSTRRSILRDVSIEQRTVSDIARPYAMSLASVSKHLKVLEIANLIHREKKGSFQWVRINATPMQDANQWLAYYERFWTQRLDALETILNDEDQLHNPQPNR